MCKMWCDFYKHFTANLLENLPVKKNENQLRIDRIMAMSLWPRFGPPCIHFVPLKRSPLIFHNSVKNQLI